MFESTLWQFITFTSFIGLAWVSYVVFADQNASHRDRDENSLGLFDDFTDRS
jgi:hypothetical protein